MGACKFFPVAAVAAIVATVGVSGCGSDDRDPATDSKSASTRTEPTADTKVTGRKAAFRLKPIGRFNRPVYLTQPPGDSSRLFVVEKGGRIRVIENGKKLREPFLSLRGKVSQKTEQGLLSLAFDPNYQKNRLLYISWSDRSGHLRVAEYQASKKSPNRANPFSRRFVLTVPHPNPTHYGGHLLFGPDKLLYIGLGDGGGVGDPGRNGQDRSELLGKILRIDPHQNGSKTYRSPTSNPFVQKRHVRPEVYAFGLRNPWRFSFDRKTSDLFIGDVGQETYEEVDLRRKGKAKGTNFGWSSYEGPRRFHRKLKPVGSPVDPIYSYRHKPPCSSVTGGYVVRDPQLKELYGRYLFGDFCDGMMHSLKPHLPKARDVRREHVRVPFLSSFGEDNAGRIYAMSLNGPVYRIAP